MKTITNTQKIVIGVIIILIGIIVWQFFSHPKVDTNSVANSLQDTTFVKYIQRESENKALKKDIEELRNLNVSLASKSPIYIKEIVSSKEKIQSNEKANYSNATVNDLFIKSFTSKLDTIRMGN